MEGLVAVLYEDGNKRNVEVMVDGGNIEGSVNYFPKNGGLEFTVMRGFETPRSLYCMYK